MKRWTRLEERAVPVFESGLSAAAQLSRNQKMNGDLGVKAFAKRRQLATIVSLKLPLSQKWKDASSFRARIAEGAIVVEPMTPRLAKRSA